MSTATAAVAPGAPPAKGKKKLIIIVAVAVLVLVLGGVGAMLMLKKKAADAEGADGAAVASAAPAKHEESATPTFVPLDPFTVNLADRDAERYAQVAITLQVSDEKTAEEVKAYMPAIRNNVLMAISERTSTELLGREGKAALAAKIRRETSRALGFDVPPEAGASEAAGPAAEGHSAKAGHAKEAADLPVKAVQFSNFIIQ